MSALQSLLVAVDLATRQRDAARQALLQAKAAVAAAQAQLEQLQGYANETSQRWGAHANTTLQPEVLFHHVHFMGRLEHAAGLQGNVVSDYEARVTEAQTLLVQAELRLASLQKVVESRRRAMELHQMRRDQKQTDERAALQYRKTINDASVVE